MSGEDAAYAAAPIVLQFNTQSIPNFCFHASTALLFYEYLLTFSDEIRCVWKARFSGVTLLYIFARYSTIAYRVFMIVQWAKWARSDVALSDSTAGIAWSFMTLKMNTSLGGLLLRDGSIYFALLLVLNVFLALEHSALNAASGAMADVIVSILISRFILNLRRVYFALEDETDQGIKFSTVRFARTLTGNLGAPLEFASSSRSTPSWRSSTGWEDFPSDLESEREEEAEEPILAGLSPRVVQQTPFLTMSLEGPQLEIPLNFLTAGPKHDQRFPDLMTEG
ncbi:hypothetical protein EIP91_003840 [Steccherinum ochraceum]|uniref:DUF6533 domain-containing protein n=1 Tax=Steccherinum ochraceum TaxID=92696 RepID=A0A4R0RLF2_9APHY|nr:hypothetical protein EIP91_003840 [Steccherinum ochraceum]